MDSNGQEFSGWTRTVLGTIIVPFTEKVFGDHNYEVLTSSRNGIQRQSEHFAGKQRHDTDGYNIIPRGYCTYRNRSDDGLFTFNMNNIVDEGIVSKFYPVFTFQNANSTFMMEYLNGSPRIRAKLSVLAVGTSQVVLSFETLKETSFYLPTFEEQNRIAALLSTLNERIEKQRLLIEHLKKYKRGAIEAIFNRTISFSSNTEDSWKEFRLGEFARRITRKNGQTTDIPLTISAQYGLIDQREFFSKTVASSDMSGYYLLHKGEFAYNRSTSSEYPFGSIKRLDKYDKGAVSTLYLCFDANEEIMDSDFIMWYFESSRWHNGVREICAEGARNHGLLNVPTAGFFDTVHYLPSNKAEQKQIAAFLSSLDERYTRAFSELEELNKLKQGLYQSLFI